MLPLPLMPAQLVPATVAQPPRNEVGGVGRVDVSGGRTAGREIDGAPALRVIAPSRKPVLLVLPLVVTTTAEPPDRTAVPLKACEVPLLLAASFSASAPPANCSV